MDFTAGIQADDSENKLATMIRWRHLELASKWSPLKQFGEFTNIIP
jgi:hypothetical protein